MTSFTRLVPLALVAAAACARSGGSGHGAATSVSSPSDPSTAVPSTHVASTTVPVPGGCSEPRRSAPDAVGCYLAATRPIGVAPATPVYWHIDRYPTRAAAESARGDRGAVAEAHGRVWLFTIADAEWRPMGGERVARVGPLPLVAGRDYVAHYIEGVVPPGARTPAHSHAGPEAWYVVEGTNCLQTPNEVRVARAGETLIVPEGSPMILTGVGPATRHSLALVVHDASRPWTIPAQPFTPKESCPQ
jgi:quercetin dioxygenase-like cupin family protein